MWDAYLAKESDDYGLGVDCEDWISDQVFEQSEVASASDFLDLDVTQKKVQPFVRNLI